MNLAIPIVGIGFIKFKWRNNPMGLQTRGSAELDKAQRRLAGLKSIDPDLDLGYGLTIGAYTQLIDTIQGEIARHNQRVAEIDASRKTLNEYDRTLAELSGRILSAVKIKYGGNSKEYSQAGGSIRKRARPPIHPQSLLTHRYQPRSQRMLPRMGMVERKSLL